VPQRQAWPVIDPARIVGQLTVAWYVILAVALAALGVHYWRERRKRRR
jgi:hypothetical protein